MSKEETYLETLTKSPEEHTVKKLKRLQASILASILALIIAKPLAVACLAALVFATNHHQYFLMALLFLPAGLLTVTWFVSIPVLIGSAVMLKMEMRKHTIRRRP